jgi:hypothetical protein
MRKLILGSLVAAALGSFAVPAAARTNVDFFVNIGPPPVYYEPGFWDWRYGRYYWVGGHYVRHRHGYYYDPVRWHYRGGRYYRSGGWRDADGDGVPNRYDRAPYNPRWR